MVVLHDLPVELLEKILRLLGDPVSVRRASLVCQQWADIIHNLLLRGSITCNPKVWWLDTQFPSFFCERFYGDWQQQKVSTRRSPSLRGIGLRLSRRGLWLLPELRRFLSFSFFFSFPIQGFSHPHGNHPSKVSQLPLQTSQRCNFKVKVNHSNHVHDLVTCNPIHNFFPL